MKDLFPEYYRPSADEFKQIWQTCLFSLDANVLLDVYRYTPDTRDRLLDILEHLQDRIWLPHQAAAEFHRNRIGVIRDLEVPYEQTQQQVVIGIDEIKSKLEPILFAGKRPHPFIAKQAIHQALDDAVQAVNEALVKAREKQPSFLQRDELLNRLTTLFSNRVGAPYSQEELDANYILAGKRYDLKIPPGFQDRGATHPKAVPQPGDPDPRAYGDAILWMQLLYKMQNEERPLVFVTGETKDDWWLKKKGQIIGPLPALIREMHEAAGTIFYMYSTDMFLRRAEEFLGLQVLPEAVDEIRDLRRLDEESASMHALRVAQAVAEMTLEQIKLERKIRENEAALDSVEERLRNHEARLGGTTDPISEFQATRIAQLVKAIALELGKRTGQNEYGEVYSTLFSQFHVTSYRQIPALRYQEVLEFLSRWYDNLFGDEPPLPVPAD